MGYLSSIKVAIACFPFLAFLFTLPFILSQYHKYGSIHKLRVLIVYSFILYLMTAYFMVILPLPSFDEVRNMTSPRMQLIPFQFVIDFLHETSFSITNPATYLLAIKESCFFVPLFNVFLTLPFGMYLRYYYQCSLKKCLFSSFFLSLFFELTQLSGLYFIYPRSYRLFDVDDLILNTLGGVLGYFFVGIFRFLPSREAIDAKAIEDGMNVSGLRRMTSIFLDLFFYLLFALLFTAMFDFKHPMLISFFLYFVGFSILMQGKTPGRAFLNMKLVFENHPIFRTILRSFFLLFYYFFFPFFLFPFLFTGISSVSLSPLFTVSLSIFLLLFFFCFHLFYMIKLLKTGKMFYDKILGFRYQSTILEKKKR